MKTKNILTKIKEKVKSAKLKVATAVAGAGATVGLGFCAGQNPNTLISKFFNLIFTLSKISGAILLIFGGIKIVSVVMAYANGDQQVQRGEIGKAAALLIGGAIAIAIDWILTGLFGINVDSFFS